jgi:hypothetical protein
VADTRERGCRVGDDDREVLGRIGVDEVDGLVEIEGLDDEACRAK